VRVCFLIDLPPELPTLPIYRPTYCACHLVLFFVSWSRPSSLPWWPWTVGIIRAYPVARDTCLSEELALIRGDSLGILISLRQQALRNEGQAPIRRTCARDSGANTSDAEIARSQTTLRPIAQYYAEAFGFDILTAAPLLRLLGSRIVFFQRASAAFVSYSFRTCSFDFNESWVNRECRCTNPFFTVFHSRTTNGDGPSVQKKGNERDKRKTGLINLCNHAALCRS
jgi:hypothetical protein